VGPPLAARQSLLLSKVVSPGPSAGAFTSVKGHVCVHAIFSRNAAIPDLKWKQFPPSRLDPNTHTRSGIEAELVMICQPTNSSQNIDRKMSWSICEAVGEQLQQSLRPERSRLPPRLEKLIHELRKRDHASLRSGSN
jgi:hypothetical protein